MSIEYYVRTESRVCEYTDPVNCTHHVVFRIQKLQRTPGNLFVTRRHGVRSKDDIGALLPRF